MFYGWYVHEVMNGAKPLKQERTEMRKFVTERLLTEIDNRHKSAGGVELDPVFNTHEIDQFRLVIISSIHAAARSRYFIAATFV